MDILLLTKPLHVYFWRKICRNLSLDTKLRINLQSWHRRIVSIATFTFNILEGFFTVILYVIFVSFSFVHLYLKHFLSDIDNYLLYDSWHVFSPINDTVNRYSLKTQINTQIFVNVPVNIRTRGNQRLNANIPAKKILRNKFSIESLVWNIVCPKTQ